MTRPFHSVISDYRMPSGAGSGRSGEAADLSQEEPAGPQASAVAKATEHGAMTATGQAHLRGVQRHLDPTG